KLHGRLDDIVGSRMKEGAPDLGRAGERDDAHARVFQHGADNLAGGPRGDDVNDAGRNAGLGQDRHQGEHRHRRVGGGLGHGPAASGGPILRVAIGAGKFHGVTRTATPAGLWWTKMRAPDDGATEFWPTLRTASSAYQRKNSAA